MTDGARNEALKAAAGKAVKRPFGGVIEIAPAGGNGFFIDGRAGPPAIADKKPKGVDIVCTWRGAEDVLLRALESERALESAYVSGRLAISGDMSVMARLTLETAR